MGIKIKIIKKEDQSISKWSGGMTTQLDIYPEDALYSERNFLWRISSAVVELPESVFTHLPGIKRIIMPINGELYLEHEGRYKKLLKPFEQDCFSGDWTTRSRGKVIDFNLMMRNCSGRIETYTVPSGSCNNISLERFEDNINYITDVFYILGEKAEFNVDNRNINVEDRELIWLLRTNDSDNSDIEVKNISQHPIKIIRTNIFY